MENRLISMRSRGLLTKYYLRAIMKTALTRKRVRRLATFPKGGVEMLITLTFYVREWAITIQVRCRNRHSGK